MLAPESNAGGAGATDEQCAARAESTALCLAQCREWLNWAAAQVDACVTNDNLAMNQLLASLTDLMGAPQPRSATGLAAVDPDMNGKMAAVIMAIQAHDRVMQGLIHVTESLRTLHAQLGDRRHAESADSWRILREKQFRAFSMPEERALFARMVAHADEGWCEGRNPEEAVELFTSDHGRYET